MKFFLLLCTCLVSVLIGGCARHDQDQTLILQEEQKQQDLSTYGYHPDTEVPEGRGILSGDDGEFILFKK